jgi:hypothetical protein
MPVLPSASSFGVATPTSSAYSPVDPNPGVVGQAYTAAGRGVQSVGSGVRSAGKSYDEYESANDRVEYAAANAAIVQERVKAEQEIPNDPNLDPTGWQKAFEDRLAPVVKEWSGKIGNTQARKLFEINAGQHVTLGGVSITKAAEARTADKGRAWLDGTIQQNDQAMWATPDPTLRASMLKSSNEAVDAAVAKGWVSADWAVGRKKQIAVDYAKGWVDTIPAAEAVKLLDPEAPAAKTNTPVDFLSPDQRRSLFYQKKQDAAATQIEVVRAATSTAATQIYSAYPGDEAAAIKAARAIGDPIVADKTADQLSKMYAQDRAGEAQQRRAVQDQAWEHVLRGGSVDTIPATIAAKLGGEVSSMQAFEARRVQNGDGFGKVTDPETYTKLTKLQASDPKAFAAFDLNTLTDKLKEGDWKQFANQQVQVQNAINEGNAKGVKNPDYGLAVSVADDFADTMGLKKGAKSAADAEKRMKLYGVAREIVDRAHAEGRVATFKEINEGMSVATLISKGSTFWGSSERVFEGKGPVSPEKMLSNPDNAPHVSRITGVPEGYIPQIVEALKASKQPVTAANIKWLWDDHARR